MRQFLLVGILLFIGNTASIFPMLDNGQKKTFGITMTMDDKDDDRGDEILLDILKGDKPVVRSLSPVIVKAYLLNQTLKIYFQDILDNVSITITNIGTGMIVYRTDCYSSTIVFDLDMLEKGTYCLDIVSEDEWLQGEFTL